MDERHDHEQYFFDDQTLALLCDWLTAFENPCLVCAPMLATALENRGRSVRLLDIDHRFAALQGFVDWNIKRPTRLAERFDVIVCDPPFFNVSLNQLFKSVRLLSHFSFTQPLAISYLSRRANALLRAFEPFKLQISELHPTYRTIERSPKNEIQFFANVDMPVTRS